MEFVIVGLAVVVVLQAASLILATRALERERASFREREAALLKREDSLLNRVMARDVQDYTMAEAYSRSYADMKAQRAAEPERDLAAAFGAEQEATPIA